MTTIITSPEDLTRSDPDDSVLLVLDGFATPFRSSVQTCSCPIEDLPLARGWTPQPEPVHRSWLRRMLDAVKAAFR